MKIFFQSNYTDYGHFDKKKYIEIFSSETWTELIFGWSTFKIICDTSASTKEVCHCYRVRWNLIKWQEKKNQLIFEAWGSELLFIFRR